MFDKQLLQEEARNNPQMQRAVDAIEAQIGTVSITPEIIGEVIDFLEMVLSDPSKYPQMRQMVIQEGYASEQDLPAEFNAMYLGAMLIAFYGLQERYANPQKFNRGGLARVVQDIAQQGRGGDTMLAHINPREAEALRRMGGAGTVNPNTGVVEFKGGIGKILSVIAPIALNFIIPGAGAALGAALGATGTAASVIGGAIIGGVSSSLGGGNFLKGAALGGLGGGLGSAVGGAANDALGLGLGASATKALGSGLVGGVMGAASGKGALQGALSGAAGSFLGDQVGGMAGSGALGQGVQDGSNMFGNMMAAGYDPKEALAGGALAGVAGGMGYKPEADNSWTKPSDAVIENMKAPLQPAPVDPYSSSGHMPGEGANYNSSTAVNAVAPAAVAAPTVGGVGHAPGEGANYGVNLPTGATTPTSSATGALGKVGNWLKDMDVEKASKLLTMATTVTSLMKAPPQVQSAVSALTPQQQAYLSQPSTSWDWGKMQNDANQQGVSLQQYMSNNWNKISGYNQPGGAASGQYSVPNVAPLKQFARGGLNFMKGGGSGRDDLIDAKVSPGEYIFDAETTALLGDGSPEEGARKLDQMRMAIRAHKGKALAKGKISADAKSPLAYLGAMK